MSHVRFAFLTVALALVAALGAGCAEEGETINRVQPNVVDKDMFNGQWYFQQTVIDTPYSAGYTFVGEQGDLEKIEWEIQENFLIARRAYDFISGSEPGGVSGASEDHAAIAMYAIESHFDIRREYNPTTGEEINVISENTSDRPWRDRDFMRVDWSQNLITDHSFLVGARLFDAITTEPVAYYVQDPEHPDAPKFVRRDPADEDSEIHYIDIVNKMFVTPESVALPGYPVPLPICYLTGTSHLDCSPGEITVRHSFLKVDPNRDYQPMLYTGDRMERFGYFVSERAGFDPHYGVIESERFRFVNRHNLWQQSHVRGDDGLMVRCQTDAECGGDRGSVCDLDYARAHRETRDNQWLGACTIPFRDREVRPIPYFLSTNFPTDLEPDADHLGESWNEAFVATVGSLRANECLAHGGGDAAACDAERTREDAQHMFVICHSPVRDDDPQACGERGTFAHVGDLRFSMIPYVSEPHLSSPLGYGPSSADPETGELIQANAFVYGAAMETLTTFARDIVALLNGDLSETDISSGANVQAWADRMVAEGSGESGRTRDDHVVHLDGLDASRINEAMDFSWARDFGSRAAGRPGSPREMLERFDSSLQTLYRNGAFGNGGAGSRAVLSRLVGTSIEQEMTSDDMLIAAGIDPSTRPADVLPDGMLDMASPLRGRSLQAMRALELARNRMHVDSCVLNADFADEGMLGLAREITRSVEDGDGTMTWYGQVYPLVGGDGAIDYEQVRSMLRHPIFDAVTAHEVGHTVGLRHNFSGSYDALNFHPRYWELRNDGDMMPRAWDPMSEEEVDGRIREYQYSTVMDYGNNFVVTDSEGIGHYDHAAIKMGYGDMVEVFANAEDPGEVAWIGFIQSAGWPVPLKLEAFTGGEVTAYTYTEIPQVLGGIDRVQQRVDIPYSALRADMFLASQGIRDPLVDNLGRPAVPYLFCSDEQADLNPDCLRYDAGADAYESLQSVIDNYWNYYIFNAFRRQRLGFNTGAYADRVLGRYFAKVQNANQIYSLYRGVFEDIFGDDPSFDRFWTRPDGMGAWTTGVGAGYQLLTQVVTAPEPGDYQADTRGDGTRALLPGGGMFADAVVDTLDGRYIETTWDFDAGYFWFDQLDRAGYYYDKVIALQVLADPETHFVGRDTAADVRRYQINYYSSFAPSLSSFMRGLVGEDWHTISPRSTREGIVWPDPLQLASGDMAGDPIDPNASFSIQMYAAVYGMGLIPDTFDPAYRESARIFVRGGPEGVELAPGTPVVEFVYNGNTYVALSLEDATGRQLGVGAQMLEHAQALQDNGADAELTRYIDNIDVVRQLSWSLYFGG